VDLALGGWAASLNAATRKTSFDSFPTDVATRPRTGTPIEVFVNAQCSLHDAEYGGSLSYNALSWSVYSSGTWSNYDDVSCAYDRSLPNAPGRFSRGQFEQFAGVFLDQAAARAGGRLGEDTRLLSSQIGAGASYRWQRLGLAFDYLRSQDEFDAGLQNNYALTATVKVNKWLSLDLTAGATSSDGAASGTTSGGSGVTPYGGLYASLSF
jgi:hypothetical protein